MTDEKKTSLGAFLVSVCTLIALVASFLLGHPVTVTESSESLGGTVYNRAVSFDEGIKVDGTTVITGAGAVVAPVTGSTASYSGALAANGGITFDAATDTVGAHTLSGTLDANANILTNIGNTGTDFVASTGALTLAGILSANGGVTSNGLVTLGPSTSHLKSTQTTAPVATQSAGTPTLTSGSTDTAGYVTSDTTSHTTVIVTFNATYTTAPFCAVTAGDSDAAAIEGESTGVYAVTSATALTITHAASSAAAEWSYVCVGH